MNNNKPSSGAPVTACHDNDSPWLVCKPCNDAGHCSRAAFDRWVSIERPSLMNTVMACGDLAHINVNDAAWLAWQASAAAERERIKARLLAMHAEANGRHNYYACAAAELFGEQR